jgi:hypothetical protein
MNNDELSEACLLVDSSQGSGWKINSFDGTRFDSRPWHILSFSKISLKFAWTNPTRCPSLDSDWEHQLGTERSFSFLASARAFIPQNLSLYYPKR